MQLQTTQEKPSIVQLTSRIIRSQGVTALYNGISASLLRQMTYSTTRFGIYEVGKQSFGSDLGFLGKVALAGFAGACGGVCYCIICNDSLGLKKALKTNFDLCFRCGRDSCRFSQRKNAE